MKDYYKCMCCEREVPSGSVRDKETWVCPRFAFYKYDIWKEERLWCTYCLGITDKHGEDIVKEKERKAMKKIPAKKTPAKKTAVKKTRVDRICDLVDCHIEGEITQDELVEKLMTVVGKPIIKVSEVEFIVSEWEGNLYLESRQEITNGCRDNWVQVEDLTDFTVGEYNDLVTQLNEVYPEYPIEYLEGRFV